MNGKIKITEVVLMKITRMEYQLTTNSINNHTLSDLL